MSKASDKVEELEEWKRNKEAEERAWKKLTARVRLWCIISINAGAAGAYVLKDVGSFLYTYCEPLRTWIDRIITASRGQ